jgi:plasmid stability protein
MATVTIRNLDDGLVDKLKAQAKANHRSLEAELRDILAKEMQQREMMRKFRARARRIAAMTPEVPQTDSAILIREDRDR